METPFLRIISLGAGVQSTTMTLMAAHGELTPMPDCAIFADTGWEPAGVYSHLGWLSSANVLPFPVYVVSSGNIREDLLARSSSRAGRFVTIPAFLLQSSGKRGMGRRQCTSHYKVEPIRRKIRELLGKGPRSRIPAGAVEKWIGISVDEIIRATPSRVAFEVNRHPLLEKGLSRQDCISWLKSHGYSIPPKSACIGCPFHNNKTWKSIRDNSPAEWKQAVEVDAAIRELVTSEGKPLLRGKQFLHNTCVPLGEADLDPGSDSYNLFVNECEGMCGV